MLILNLLLAVPLTVCAQSLTRSSTSTNSSSSASSSSTPTQTVITSFSVTTGVTLGPNRQLSSFTTTTNFTTTIPIASPSNQTSSANSTTTSTTASQILPTAPTTIAGGGSGGAPVPGQTGVNGQYGPGDGYIAAATSLHRNTFFVSIAGILVGGVLML